MKRFITIVFTLLIAFSYGQTDTDERINALAEKYTKDQQVNCEILIKTDVEGMVVPDKVIKVGFRENGKMEVKGKGIALLPKKGMINQFKELLSSPFQAIYLSKRKNNLVYKLVSLDQNSDWITADIEFDEQTLLIYKSVINTRKFGAFHIEHTYSNGYMFPETSVIMFNAKKFKMPLKFIGRTEGVPADQSRDEEIQGKVTLQYTYLD